jgi:hypothetical protein
LTEGLGHIEAGINEFVHIDTDEQQTGRVKQRIMRLACLLAMRRCAREEEVFYLADLNV